MASRCTAILKRLVLLSALTLPAAAQPPLTPDAARLNELDAAIDQAIAQHRMPGAVLYLGANDRDIYRKAYGHRALKPEPIAMTPDTLFDLASLSKPVGCSTSIMIL